MAARKGSKTRTARVQVRVPKEIAQLLATPADAKRFADWLSDQPPSVFVEADARSMGHAVPAGDTRAAYGAKANPRATPASESALNDLQAALRDLGSEVIQLRNELELVLAPAGPRPVADSNPVPEPPRSPLTGRIRDMIGDATGTRDMLRDIRDRLEVGAQEPGNIRGHT